MRYRSVHLATGYWLVVIYMTEVKRINDCVSVPDFVVISSIIPYLL